MPAKTVYYASVGPVLTLYDIDVETAALTRRGSVTLPANIQYAWPRPSKRFLYVVSSNGGPGIVGDKHFAHAFGDRAAFGRHHVAMATEAGFVSAASALAGVVQAEGRTNLRALPRIGARVAV